MNPPTYGRSYHLGATIAEGGVNFSLFSRTATGVELLFFDREDDAKPSRVVSARSGRRIGPTTTGTRSCPACSRGRSTAIASSGPSDPAQGLRFDPDQGAARPVRPRRGRPEGLRPRGRAATGRQRRDGDEERGRRSARVRLGGRRAAAPALRADHHLRDARPRLHAPPEFRRRRADPRHLRRADREDPVPPGSRHHRRRVAAGASRSTPRPARRGWSTTGAISRSRSSRRTRRTARAATRSARWTSSATWSRPCTAPASR